MTTRGRLADFGYAAGWRMVRALPESVAARLFDAGADYAARAEGPDQLRRNLARVLGCAPDRVPAALIRDSLRSYARYWREAFRLPTMDLTAVAAAVTAVATGAEQVDAALESGSGAILALPHTGNWDVAGVFAVSRWGPITTVNERLRPESLYQRFVRYRESLGFEILPATGGPVAPSTVLAQRLRENRVICLLGERDLSGKGVPVRFFGEPTSMPAGPAKLAIDTGAPLFPVHCWFDGPHGWGCDVGEPVDTSAGTDTATQLLADRFAVNIAAYPADWHMLQPLWLDDLSAQRRARLEQGRAS